jgi:formate/nitrite transporter FocA (FNT family)
MTRIGVEAAGVTASHVFWSGVIGGWIIALVAWLVSGSHSITGSVMLIWLLTFVVGLGGFAHCIATSGEILAAILDHQLAISRVLRMACCRQRWAISAAACCWLLCSSTAR